MARTTTKSKKRKARSTGKKRPAKAKPVSAAEARKALDEIGRASKANGTDKLTDEEIDAEIKAYREGR